LLTIDILRVTIYQRGRQQALLNTRRENLQKWITGVLSLRASHLATPVLEFLGVTERSQGRNKYEVAEFLPQIPSLYSLPVHSVHYEVSNGLLLVASGVAQFTKKKDFKIGGALQVFTIQEKGGQKSSVGGNANYEPEDAQSFHSAVDTTAAKFGGQSPYANVYAAQKPLSAITPKLSQSDEHRSSLQRASIVSPYLPSEQRELVPACHQLFNCCVVSAKWDSRRQVIYVALATGPILLYQLNEKEDGLVYMGELDYANDPLCNLIYDYDRDTLILASHSSSLMGFSLKQGELVSQTTWGGARFTIISYDTYLNISFCGTTVGSVFVYDMSQSLPNLVFKITLPYSDVKLQDGNIMGLWFEEQTRLLYVAHGSSVFIYLILDKTQPILWTTLTISATARISTLLCVDMGRFVIVGCTGGGIAVFDMTSEAALDDNSTVERSRTLDEVASSQSVKALTKEMESDKFIHRVPWIQVIKGSNAFMRQWLTEEGVDFSGASRRMDLIRLVAGVVGASVRTTAEMLLPASPRKDVMFATKLPGAIMSSCYVEDMHAILFGSTDGVMFMLSANILSKKSFSIDVEEWGHMRQSVITSGTSSPTGIIRNLSAFDRGKKHEIVIAEEEQLIPEDIELDEGDRMSVFGDMRVKSIDHDDPSLTELELDENDVQG
jgi:hypothetical protein